jgi:hypothetical protein
VTAPGRPARRLVRAVDQLRRFAVPVLVLVLLGTVGVLAQRALTEDDRIERRVTDSVTARLSVVQQRQGAQQAAQQAALCIKWKAEASADLTPTSTQLGRDLVRTAASAYQLVGCADVLGDLDPIDPEAYSPAPPRPTPTPR